jgi:hypothetical protein
MFARLLGRGALGRRFEQASAPGVERSAVWSAGLSIKR